MLQKISLKNRFSSLEEPPSPQIPLIFSSVQKSNKVPLFDIEPWNQAEQGQWSLWRRT